MILLEDTYEANVVYNEIPNPKVIKKFVSEIKSLVYAKTSNISDTLQRLNYCPKRRKVIAHSGETQHTK